MGAQELLLGWQTPQQLPIKFHYGDEAVQGIPESWFPQVRQQALDGNITLTIVTGCSPEGLEVRVECKRYRDFPAVEYVAFLTNRGSENSPMIQNARIGGLIPGEAARLYHGNGDTKDREGYEWWYTPIGREPLTVQPSGDGTSCFGAFPYMRLLWEDRGVNLAFGWTGDWTADFTQTQEGIALWMGQKRCHTVLYPGETLRLPSLTMLAYEGDEDAGRNSWRHWYFAHVLPKMKGKPLEPKCCMHLFEAQGKPEFTGATEENQCAAIDSYLRAGIQPDVWWIDAGWYPCNFQWGMLGNWYPNPEHFPRGLKPLGDKCHENGMDFLLWYEPERVRVGTEFAEKYPQWLIPSVPMEHITPSFLVDLGNRECCEHMIDLIDGQIKEFGVDIYRQDFNFSKKHGLPSECWASVETPDRIGARENLHIQGYYRLWDSLLARNPGLLIDSCASGGRRNDIESMRRAVALHYTDVGYGEHPVKLKQHRQMFEWIPYFRAHNQNWCAQDGSYDRQSRPVDTYSYYVAMAPALTDLTPPDGDGAAMALARRMQPIWRKAAQLMLDTDYYPLTQCRKDSGDFYAAQFLTRDGQKGMLHMVNGATADRQDFTVQLKGLQEDADYVLTSAEQERSWLCKGKQLMAGLCVQLPKKTADIWFMERK